MASPHAALSEADLHGLVDGHLDADRRIDALRRLAAAPGDRARVESWQRQTDLLRNAFAGVEAEPLPAALDLKTRPPLHCVPAVERPIQPTPAAPAARPWSRLGTMAGTLVIAAACLGGSWLFFDTDGSTDPVVEARLRGTTIGPRTASDAAPAPAAPAEPPGALPTTRIPDLTPAGFAFVGAEPGDAGGRSLVFRYRNEAAERVVVSVGRAGDGDVEDAAPTRVGNAYGWRKHARAYTIAGTLRPARLRAIAVALQKDLTHGD